MPAFCTKCGSPVEGSLKFCPKCGNAMAAAAPAAGSQPQAAAPAPSPAAAPTKGSPVLKIILAIAGVLVLIMVIAIAGIVYVGYRVKKKADEFKQTFKVDQSGQSVTIQTPKGPVVIGENKDAAATIAKQVPPYPGAKTTSSGGISGPGGSGFSGAEYETSDSVDKVVSFYKEKLGPKLTVTQSEGTAILQLTTATGSINIAVSREKDGNTTKIAATEMSK